MGPAVFVITLFFGFYVHADGVEDNDLPVGISEGVVITEVQNLILFNEEQNLHFFIPDVPDVPSLSSFNCETQPYTEACESTSVLNDINGDSVMLLAMINKMLTKSGLQEATAEDPVSSDAKFVMVEQSKSNSEPPPERFIQDAGAQWYELLKQRLERRKITKPEEQATKSRNERSIWAHVAKGATGIAALMGIDDLFGFFTDLFVPEDKILSILTTLKAYLPVDRKSFADIVKQTSEFESFAKTKFAEILGDNKQLTNLTTRLDNEVRNHALDISVVQDGYSQSQRVLADTTTLLFTSIVYMLQISAFHTCRAKEIPLAYLPPSLLQSTLAKLADELSPDVELAIPLQHTSLYYTMDNMCSCLFDDNGGVLRLSVPLRQKDAIFQLYKIMPIQFAWENLTCVLDLDASYVVREKRTNFVFPVTAVDAAECDVVNSKKCRIPASTADDMTSSCVSIILSGGTTEQLKSGCPIHCAEHSQPEVAKISPSTFIATHVPPNALTVRCPDENRTIDEEVIYGAVKITTGCSCTLYLNGRQIGRSTKSLCSDTDVLNVESILPVHFVISKDIIHFSDKSGADTPRFRHKSEIFNADFLQELQPEEDDKYFTTKFNLISAIWNVFQSLLLAYSFFRVHTLSALVYPLTRTDMPMVQAASNYTCKLPIDAYYLLIAILIVCTLSTIPQMIYFVWRLLTKCFWQTVEVKALEMNVQNEMVKQAIAQNGSNVAEPQMLKMTA